MSTRFPPEARRLGHALAQLCAEALEQAERMIADGREPQSRLELAIAKYRTARLAAAQAPRSGVYFGELHLEGAGGTGAYVELAGGSLEPTRCPPDAEMVAHLLLRDRARLTAPLPQADARAGRYSKLAAGTWKERILQPTWTLPVAMVDAFLEDPAGVAGLHS